MQPDSSQQAAQTRSRMTGSDGEIVEIVLVAPEGRPILHAAYFFSSQSRKSSVGEKLKAMAICQSCSLVLQEVDILKGGAAHDLIDSDSQARLEAHIRDGEVDVTIIAPPCSSWTRALFRPGGPKPCRDKADPWGFPHARTTSGQMRARATSVCISPSARPRLPLLPKSDQE